MPHYITDEKNVNGTVKQFGSSRDKAVNDI